MLSFSLKEYRQANPLQAPQRGPYGERYPITGHLTSLLIYLFISEALKALRKERPSMFPKSGAPMESSAHSRALLNISVKVPRKGALPPGPTHGVPSERDAPFLEPSTHHSKSPVYEPPLLIPGSPLT